MTEPAVLTFTARGRPVAQGSMRSPAIGVLVHDSPRLVSWRRTIGWAAIEALQWLGTDGGTRFPLRGAVAVEARFRLPRPKGVPRAKRKYPTVRKDDIDKLTRALLDALSGIAYSDDGQVCSLLVTRGYDDFGEGPGVDVLVRTWEA